MNLGFLLTESKGTFLSNDYVNDAGKRRNQKPTPAIIKEREGINKNTNPVSVEDDSHCKGSEKYYHLDSILFRT